MTDKLPAEGWHEANQRSLVGRLLTIRTALQQHIARRGGAEAPPSAVDADEPGARTALNGLCALLKLSPFERDILLLCAGIELDSQFAPLCADAHADPARPYPTFSLALAALPEPHWSALTPHSPLRRHRLIAIADGPSLTTSALRIDERILHCLLGLNRWDERLRGIVDPAPPAGPLVPSHQAQAERIAALWRRSGMASPIVQLCGLERAAKRRIAAEACRLSGLGLGRLMLEALPQSPAELDLVIQLWDREAALTSSALLVEADELESGDTARMSVLARVVERAGGLILLSTYVRQPMRHRPMITIDVANPTLREQGVLWNQALGEEASSLNGHVDQLTAQFDVTDLAIHAASAEALALAAGEDAPGETRVATLGRALWETCRVSARPRLDDLAQRIESMADWDDLVLPEAQITILRDIAGHVRMRSKVYQQWGFAAKGQRGLGISALFAGASGTGKTMAAEVLARALALDLYRIDLSAVVSKYIGETEKNLRRVFDTAEGGGAILLFDEADALFGKRTETKDSHDRYANQEVAYLLQRMEAYRGLAILTTNLRSSLDVAFMRRLRYVIQFPFPDTAQREELWRRAFPADAPTEGLSPRKLAQLNVAGGHVRNIALNAAFLAAEAGDPIRMRHILRAAQAEYSKLEKTLTDAEIAGWV